MKENFKLKNRNLILTLVLNFFCLNLQAQSSFVKEWEKTFGGEENDFLWDVKPTSDGGFILGGSSSSGVGKDKTEPSKSFYDDIWVIKLDAKGNKQWDRTIGGKEGDELRVLHQISDGGYILGGESWSDVSGDKSEPSRGRRDWWLVKLDKNGNKIWDKTYGGDSDEVLRVMLVTSDGGFVLGGESHSGISGEKTKGTRLNDTLYSYMDYWVLRLDANGNKLWDQVIDRNKKNEIRYFKQTADKGFVLGGMYVPAIKSSTGTDSAGATNFWVIKLDADGTIKWDKNFGNSRSYDFISSLDQTPDGGYILGGTSNYILEGDKHAPGRNGSDGWIVKLDGQGNKQWDKKINSGIDDKVRSVIQVSDKSYVVAGYSGSYEKDQKYSVLDHWTAKNNWVIKLAPDGETVWESKFESNKDVLGYIYPAPDKGYFVTGSYSKKIENEDVDAFDFGFAREKRIYETWVMKLDSKGKKTWSDRISRKEHHTFDQLEPAKDGGFILWGQEFPKSYNIADYWIAKFGKKKGK